MARSGWKRSGQPRLGADLGLAGVLVVMTLCASPAAAWVDLDVPFVRDDPRGIHVLDGSYVLNVGEVHVNITNWGLIGSHFSAVTRYSDSPSAQWPAGSGVEYLWCAGLWVGGVLLGERLVSTGQYTPEFRPRDDLRDTIYEAIRTRLIRPPGNDLAGGKRLPEVGADDDEDGLIDEEILNGYDDDEDGLIDEDFGQIGNQMMVCTMFDNTRLAQELYADHTPLNLQVVMQAFQWENDTVDDFVGFEFYITNIGVTPLTDVYIGFFADPDIGQRGRPGLADDDMWGWFDGWVQALDGSYVPVSIGYMYDDDGDDGVAPGYMGLLFLGHDTDPTGQTAPTSVRLRSAQAFSGQQSFDQGGDPTNDAERYELLSVDEKDSPTQPGKQNDFRFLISAGPFKRIEPDRTLTFQAALVLGDGLSGMLRNAAEAVQTFYGNFFNLDGDPLTGVNGRETLICRQDFTAPPGQDNPIFNFVADYMDTTCITPEFLLGRPRITNSDLFVYFPPDGGPPKDCIYVNLDNCFECGRQNGRACTKENQTDTQAGWNCWDPDVPVSQKAGCTGIDGNESQITWLVGMAPPPPGLRVWPTDTSAHVFWDNRSEVTPDVRTNQIDFESYRVWRADNWDRPFGSSLENGPESTLWSLIAEYDVANHWITSRVIDGVARYDTLPLGPNTGLEDIIYTPICLADERFMGLAEAMQAVVDADSAGLLLTRPALRDRNGTPIPKYMGLLPWEGYPAVLDTFFMVTAREEQEPFIREKLATRFYEYIDREVHNGFIYFYSVTATDHAITPVGGDWRIIGAGQSGDPGSSFTYTVPATMAQTPEERERFGPNIYVYPNPATRAALRDFQQLRPNSEDPTGVRVAFANLPRARNKISIFTEDGDLVQTIEHDGTGGYGQTSWNLVSRNGQEVVSGIYLYAVQSDDKSFDDFIGKFVIIR